MFNTQRCCNYLVNKLFKGIHTQNKTKSIVRPRRGGGKSVFYYLLKIHTIVDFFLFFLFHDVIIHFRFNHVDIEEKKNDDDEDYNEKDHVYMFTDSKMADDEEKKNADEKNWSWT